MSSSEPFFDWNMFPEREVARDVSDFLAPALEIGAVLQRQEAALARVQQEAEHDRSEYLQILAKQAVLVYKFNVKLNEIKAGLEKSPDARTYSTLDLLRKMMVDLLNNAGLEIETPLGVPYQQIADRVDISGWQHRKEFTEEIVIEVQEPIVTYQNMVIHLGVVTVGMPLLEEQEHATPDKVEEN